MKKLSYLIVVLTAMFCSCSSDEENSLSVNTIDDNCLVFQLDDAVTSENINEVCHNISDKMYPDFDFQYSVAFKDVTRTANEKNEILEFYPDGNPTFSVTIEEQENGDCIAVVSQGEIIMNEIRVTSSLQGNMLCLDFEKIDRSITRGWLDCMTNIVTKHKAYIVVGTAAALDPTNTCRIVYGALVGVAALACAG